MDIIEQPTETTARPTRRDSKRTIAAASVVALAAIALAAYTWVDTAGDLKRYHAADVASEANMVAVDVYVDLHDQPLHEIRGGREMVTGKRGTEFQRDIETVWTHFDCALGLPGLVVTVDVTSPEEKSGTAHNEFVLEPIPGDITPCGAIPGQPVEPGVNV